MNVQSIGQKPGPSYVSYGSALFRAQEPIEQLLRTIFQQRGFTTLEQYESFIRNNLHLDQIKKSGIKGYFKHKVIAHGKLNTP